MSRTVCLAANCIGYPEGGGHLWVYLNWALGLRALGCRVTWMERVGGTFFGSPVCVDGKIYAVSNLGEVDVIDGGAEFKVLARNQLGEASHATPAISGGIMYLRTVSHLISVGGKKP